MTNAVPSWSVQSVTPFTDFVPGRGAVEGAQVTFTTTSGLTGSIFVPTAQLGNTDAIAGSIAQRVSELHAINTLSG